METKITINESKNVNDYFPSLFSNKDKSIIILADSRTTDKTFSGMIIHSSNETKNGRIGLYSTGWTYLQFARLPKGTLLNIEVKQSQ